MMMWLSCLSNHSFATHPEEEQPEIVTTGNELYASEEKQEIKAENAEEEESRDEAKSV